MSLKTLIRIKRSVIHRTINIIQMLYIVVKGRWEITPYSVNATFIDSFGEENSIVLTGKLRICKFTRKTMRKSTGDNWKKISYQEFECFMNDNVSLVQASKENIYEMDEIEIFDSED